MAKSNTKLVKGALVTVAPGTDKAALEQLTGGKHVQVTWGNAEKVSERVGLNLAQLWKAMNKAEDHNKTLYVVTEDVWV